MDCNNITVLKSQYFPYTYKDNNSISRCKKEQALLKAISKDDINNFKRLTSEISVFDLDAEFILWNSTSNYIALKPIHIAVIMNSRKIFNYIMDYYKHQQLRDDAVEGGNKIFSYGYGFGLNGKSMENSVRYEYTLVALTMVYDRPEMLKKLTVSVDPYSLAMANDLINNAYIGAFATPALYDIYIKALKNNKLFDESLYQKIFNEAAKYNNAKLVEHIVKSEQIDLNKKTKFSDDTYGSKALFIAIGYKNVKVVEKLIDLGINVTEDDVKGISDLKEQGLWKKDLPKATK